MAKVVCFKCSRSMGTSSLDDLAPDGVEFGICLPCRTVRDREWREEVGATSRRTPLGAWPPQIGPSVNSLLWTAFILGLVIGVLLGLLPLAI